MIKIIILDGKKIVIKTREPSAGLEKVVSSKKIYKRAREKENLNVQKN